MATILIVDDRAMCREFLVTLLKYGHHTLIEAADGAEALQLIQKKHPDLIITDLLMPTMSGYELVQKIKEDATVAKIPIIFYTASFLLDEAKLLADTCGVRHVLFKPCDPQLILETVKAALDENNIHTETKTEKQPKVVPITDVAVKHQQPSTHKHHLTHYLSELETTKATFTTAILETMQLAKEDEHLLKMSEQLSHNFNQLNKISNQLLSISQLCLLMIPERDAKQLLTIFCQGACKIVGSKYCCLGIFDNDNTKLKYFFISDANKTLEKTGTALLTSSLIKQLLTTEFALQVNDINAQVKSEFLPIHPLLNGFLGARLITATHLYGFMYFADKINDTPFTTDDCRIINTLSSEVAMLYENIELYDIIQRHAAKLQISISEHEKNKRHSLEMQGR